MRQVRHTENSPTLFSLLLVLQRDRLGPSPVEFFPYPERDPEQGDSKRNLLDYSTGWLFHAQILILNIFEFLLLQLHEVFRHPNKDTIDNVFLWRQKKRKRN